MTERPQLSVWQRVALAFAAFFAILFNRTFAVEVRQLKAGLPPAQLPERGEGAGDGRRQHPDALNLLAILQRDGRLIDFLEEDVAAYSDSEVGAAARTVHEGCRKALKDYLTLEPVVAEPEGASVEVKKDFDPASVRLTGNVVGSPPFRGSLRHHGWRASLVKLPSPAGQDPSILAPAEVELS